eukprot:1599758-Alexandrium_andersonii.AAC.1
MPAASSRPATAAAPDDGEPAADAAARPAMPAAVTSTPSDPAWRAASIDTRGSFGASRGLCSAAQASADQ